MMSANESTPTLLSWLVFSPGRDAQHGTALRGWSGHRAAVAARLRELAPYAVMLVLPGGSVMALLWWLYRRQRGQAFFDSLDVAAHKHKPQGSITSASSGPD
jgi:hypothetical protein